MAKGRETNRNIIDGQFIRVKGKSKSVGPIELNIRNLSYDVGN